MKERLKEIRKVQKLTQKEFADMLGIKQNTVASYEMGRINISDTVIHSICREFSVNEEWLRTGEGEMMKSLTKNQEIQEFVNEVMADVDESFRKKLILSLSKLKVEQWEVLEQIAKDLL